MAHVAERNEILGDILAAILMLLLVVKLKNFARIVF
jgi:hypothetical protein